ncbi:unnamed protein product, partial [Sphacelaria rigidula]
MGQDECIFKAYLGEGKEWEIAGVRGIRKKTEGPGIMVSAFQDEIRGFGFEMTGDELARVNAFRSTQGRGTLKQTSGTRFLKYGNNKEYYWKYGMFAEQCVDIMDCFEVLYPDWQLVMEVDHPSGHAKYREDGLHVGNMNVKWGGAKGSSMRSTTVTAGCLGLKPATMTWKGKEGKPKGIRQMLWERGLWEDSMTGSADPISGKNIFTVLGDCSDFKEERTALQYAFESRGHILIMSPKCHPELGGVSIEYSWGRGKLEFWRRMNDEEPENLKDNMLKALNTETILTLGRIRRFARRTREYRRTY